jgi:hypothetical protein
MMARNLNMTDLVAIPDHTIWLEFTCDRVVPVPVSSAPAGCLTVDDLRRVARCSECGAKVKLGNYGVRLTWSLAGHRNS